MPKCLSLCLSLMYFSSVSPTGILLCSSAELLRLGSRVGRRETRRLGSKVGRRETRQMGRQLHGKHKLW